MTDEERVDVIRVVDQLTLALHLNEACFMASQDISDDGRRDAMSTLINLISNKIEGAKSDLDKIRNKESDMGLCGGGA
jgi:hypothetical protein